MRVEFVLIAAILIFCCWCAYILFSINSSVTATATTKTSFPTMNSYDSSSSTSSLFPPLLRSSRAQDSREIYSKHPYATRNEQFYPYQLRPQSQHQQASSNRPFWESVSNSQDDTSNNRVSLSRYFRHPQARQNDFVANNLSNVHPQANRDYYSSVPSSLVVNYKRARPSEKDEVAHTVTGDLLRKPKETNSDLKLEPELDEETDADTESEPDTNDKQEIVGEVEPDSGSEHDNEGDDAEHEQQLNPDEQQVHRRSSSLEQEETKTGTNRVNKIGNKVKHPSNWNKQSKDVQIISDPKVLFPSGLSAGFTVLNKNLLDADQHQQLQSQDKRDRSADNVMRSGKEAGGSAGSQGLIEADGKLRAYVGKTDNDTLNQQNLTDRKERILRYPIRYENLSKVNKSPKKDSHMHRVKESLTAQHWDDDASSPPEKRTQRPDSQVETDANEDQTEAETGAGDSPHNSFEEEEENGDPSSPSEQIEGDAKEEMEAEGETGSQQVGPEKGELDLVVDPEQFMHSSDRRKREASSNSYNDTAVPIDKVSPKMSAETISNAKMARQNEELSDDRNNVSNEFMNEGPTTITNLERFLSKRELPAKNFEKTKHSMLNEGSPSRTSERWNHSTIDIAKTASLLNENRSSIEQRPDTERGFDVSNENLIVLPNKEYLPVSQPIFEPLSTTIVYDNDHVVLPMLNTSPDMLDNFKLKSSESKSKNSKVSSKTRKKKKKTESKLIKSKSKGAELMRMNKKGKSSKETNYNKDNKAKKKLVKRHKQFAASKVGFNKAKGGKQAGTNTDAIYHKDKGYRKRGFKKKYEKLESGEKKSYFDEFRDKDHNKRWKEFDDRHNYGRKKSWNGNEGKKYRNFSLDELRDKKAGKWKNSSMSKVKKAHERRSSKSLTKKKKRKKSKKKMIKKQSERKMTT